MKREGAAYFRNAYRRGSRCAPLKSPTSVSRINRKRVVDHVNNVCHLETVSGRFPSGSNESEENDPLTRSRRPHVDRIVLLGLLVRGDAPHDRILLVVDLLHVGRVIIRRR